VPRRALDHGRVIAADEDGQRTLERPRREIEAVEGVVAPLVAGGPVREQPPHDGQALLRHVAAPGGAPAREEALELLAVGAGAAPRITRPPEKRSSVATCLARYTGSRSGRTIVAVASRIRRVTPAAAARTISGS
jgi:hypothetical protein